MTLLPRGGLYLLCLSFVFACSGEKECFDDRSCSASMRCAEASFGEPGVCVPCEDTETPYDGIDNDCLRRTRDLDLDGDGDNWINSSMSPGGDCDDNDPEVSSLMSETCDDNKDNDCDGVIDELDCRDQEAPMVAFISPRSGVGVLGTIEVQLSLADDVGVESVVLTVNGVEESMRTLSPVMNQTLTLELDTRKYPDGPQTLRAEAIDVADRRGSAELMLNVDNVSPPAVTSLRPVANGAHSGLMTVRARIQDISNVERAELYLDDALLRSFTSSVPASALNVELLVDTSTMSEGEHALRYEVEDGSSNTGTVVVPFQVDNTAPTVQILSPMEAASVSGELQVMVRAMDNRNVARVALLEQSVSPDLMEVEQGFQIDTTALPNGAFVLDVSAADGTIIDNVDEGGFVATARVTVTIENSASSAPVELDPADGSVVAGKYNIVATLSPDRGDSFWNVEMKVDGQVYAEWEASRNVVQRVFDFSGASPGSHLIEIKGTDEAERQVSASSNITVVQAPVWTLPSTAHEKSVPLLTKRIHDMNGDGIQDVFNADGTHLYYGQIGPSGWGHGRSVDFHPQLTGFYKIADINGDGVDDFLGVRRDSGMATFAWADLSTNPPQVYDAFEGSIIRSELGDMDGDGDLDLVVYEVPSQLGVLINESGFFRLQGYFNVFDTFNTTLRLADLEGDGDLDIVLCGEVISAYLNNNGSFGLGLQSNGPEDFDGSDCELSELTGDTMLDVVARHGGDFVTTMAGVPGTPGLFSIAATSTVPAGPGIELADLNGDTVLDLVTGDGKAAIGAPGGSFALDDDIVFYFQVENTRALDMDGDGDIDLVGEERDTDIGSQSVEVLRVLHNNGDGTFAGSPGESFVERQLADRIIAGNFVGDPRPDIAYIRNDKFRIFESGDSSFSPVLNFDLASLGRQGWSGLTSGDLDGQGYEDIVLSNSESTTEILINNGAGMFNWHSQMFPAELVEIGEVTNDQTPDIVFATDRLGVRTTGIMNFDPVAETMSISYETPLQTSPAAIALGDIQGDGLADYAVAGASDLTMRVWNGSGFTTTPFALTNDVSALLITPLGTTPESDIALSVGNVGGGIRLIEGMSGGTFGAPSVAFNAVTTTSVVHADFNGDGLEDLFSVSANGLHLLLGSPRGDFFPATYGNEHSALPEADIGKAVAADFNGDGRPDVAIVTRKSLRVIYNQTPWP